MSKILFNFETDFYTNMSELIGVKTLKAWRTDAGGFDTFSDDKKYLFQLIEADEKNRPTREVLYAPNGKPTEEIIRRFDENYNLTERTIIHHDEGTSERIEYTYDSKNNILEESLFYGDDFIDKTIYTYNEKGEKTSHIKQDEDCNETEKELTEYNAEGNPVMISYFEFDEKTWEHKVAYDAAGFATDEYHHDFIENKKQHSRHYRDDKGRRIKSETYDGNEKLIAVAEEEYDERGNSIKTINSATVPYLSKILKTSAYNEDNQPTEHQWYDEVNKMLVGRDIFHYDEKGNLISQEIFELKTAQNIQKIHYWLVFERELFS